MTRVRFGIVSLICGIVLGISPVHGAVPAQNGRISFVRFRHWVLRTGAAGFSWVIPYVDRAERLLPEGKSLLARLAALRAATSSIPPILAASVKSPHQAVAAFTTGGCPPRRRRVREMHAQGTPIPSRRGLL